MELSDRQEKIVEIVRRQGPISGNAIASQCHVTRAALRGDFELLTSLEIIGAKRKLGYYYIGKPMDPLYNTLLNRSVEQYWSLPVVVAPDSHVYDAIIALFTEDVGSVFVSDQEHLIGIVSRKDLLKAAMRNDDLKTLPISMVMTPKSKLVTILDSESIVVAAQKMIDHEVDCLPVLHQEEDGSLRIRGRITKTNFTQIIVDLAKQKRG